MGMAYMWDTWSIGGTCSPLAEHVVQWHGKWPSGRAPGQVAWHVVQWFVMWPTSELGSLVGG